MDTAAPAQYFQPIQPNTSHPGIIEHSRRQRLTEQVATLASDTTKAVASVRAFDRTGNITASLGHLVACAERALQAAKALAADVERVNTHPDPDPKPAVGGKAGVVVVVDSGPEIPTPNDLAAAFHIAGRTLRSTGIQ